jgi:hypothetical protein
VLWLHAVARVARRQPGLQATWPLRKGEDPGAVKATQERNSAQ